MSEKRRLVDVTIEEFDFSMEALQPWEQEKVLRHLVRHHATNDPDPHMALYRIEAILSQLAPEECQRVVERLVDRHAQGDVVQWPDEVVLPVEGV